jgi:hypothetical protein
MAVVSCDYTSISDWCGHLNHYQVNTKRPKYGMLDHSPVHFTGQHIVLHDDNGEMLIPTLVWDGFVFHP